MSKHPITPPPELVQQCNQEAVGTHFEPFGYTEFIAARAAQWGADQEMEQCLRYAGDNGLSITRMRAARRPKPPSLKEQAMETLNFMESEANYDKPMFDTIRRAVEALPE
jgi:hypothetical protein